MKTSKITLAISSLVFLASCQSATQQHSEQEHTEHPQKESETNLEDIRFKDEQTASLYGFYEELRDALVEGNAESSRTAALKMESELSDESADPAFKASVEKILASDDLKVQRKAFEAFSDALIGRIKFEGLDGGSLFVAHCPMAFNDAGANWISKEKAIRNPYFGDAMLTCGSVQETIE